MEDSSSSRTLGLTAIIALVSFYAWWFRRRSANRKSPLPPGPAGWPLFGNAFDFPTKSPWLTYDRWAKKYGDIVYVNAFGQSMIILHSLEAIGDLFDRRGSIYSDRPPSEMIKMSNLMFSFAVQHYGQTWRTNRRAFHECAHQGVARQYQPEQLRATRMYVKYLLDKPQDFMQLTKTLFAVTIMKMAYGLDSKWEGDDYIEFVEGALHDMERIILPGEFLVEFLPTLKYVPEWCPGGAFKQFATRLAQRMDRIRDQPYAAFQQTKRDDSTQSCMLARMLNKLSSPPSQEEVDLVKCVGAVAYFAGSDTTVSTTLCFIMAMTMHPDIQAKAQAEVDAVVGSDRLPDFTDQSKMSYVQALILELLRWKPALNLALPHAVMEDDEYRGYFIPKGTIVLGNAWSLLHDPEIYPEPLEFKPERFLRETAEGVLEINKDIRDPSVACFGFGRRICPGRHIAEQSLFAAVSSILAVFDVLPVKDANGNPKYPTGEMTPYLVSHPEEFECEFVPRSESKARLVREAAMTHE